MKTSSSPQANHAPHNTTHTPARRRFSGALVLLPLAAALLGGCAGMSQISSDVSTFGDWPAGRDPGTYAFERLPSQQAQAVETEAVEAAARPALQKAGFVEAAPGAEPDVLVQVGARSTRTGSDPWDDPFWWRGGFGYWRHGPWVGPSWNLNMYYENRRFDREVAVLIRDRSSGKPLFEARASNEGNTMGNATLLQATFQAALTDFPRQGVNPRRVVVTLP
jgi:hypothetical protein